VSGRQGGGQVKPLSSTAENLTRRGIRKVFLSGATSFGRGSKPEKGYSTPCCGTQRSQERKGICKKDLSLRVTTPSVKALANSQRVREASPRQSKLSGRLPKRKEKKHRILFKGSQGKDRCTRRWANHRSAKGKKREGGNLGGAFSTQGYSGGKRFCRFGKSDNNTLLWGGRDRFDSG